jgi:signal transduction histidine kinase
MRHYQIVSEERLVERERSAQADRLVAMQTLTAGLAHEVRNPLNAARLQLELLERRLRRATEDDRLLDTTELIAHEIGRLSQLLDEFLAFARPPQLATDAHDLLAIVCDVVDLERIEATARGVTLTMAGDTTPVLAQVDSGKVHQVVLNLVRNAIEAAGRDGKVEIVVASTEGGAQLRVCDTGPGIPEDVRARIYEPFFSTKPEGTGMGLAIVHNLVSAHGGSIEVASGDTGTTFTVTLPRS